MKIAIIAPVFPPTPGGIGMVAQRQAQGLAARGHSVKVFTPRTMRPIFRYRHAAFVPQLLWHLWRGKFDVIHLHYPFFGGAEMVWLFALSTNHYSTKIVVTYHHDVVGEGIFKKIFTFHKRYVLLRILRKANVILVSSLDYAKNSYLSSYHPIIFPSILELPFGIDTKIFFPTPRSLELSQKYDIAPTDRVVMFLGGLDRAHYFKGVSVLIRAFKAVILIRQQAEKNPFKLVIVGEGDLRISYQQLAQDLGLKDHVIFPGYVKEEEKPAYFNLADVFVLASIDRSEAFGVVLLEAMACGKPVIASNLPGVRSVVKDKETGLLVSPGSVESLTDSLTMLLQDSVLRDTMGKAARTRVEQHYTQEQEIAALERIMKE